jgi:uncharacterized cupredoxin-like copper-binding protein
MAAMHTTPARLARTLTLLGALLLLAACTSAAGAAGWTYAPPIATAAPSGSTSPSGSPSASGSAVPSGSGSTGNVIELHETADLKITDPNGQQVSNITVKKGETYTFRITNMAGFTHNFYIGAAADLQAGNSGNLTGTGDFSSGTKEFQYTFTGDQVGFGCIVPGHYMTMHGTFTIQ